MTTWPGSASARSRSARSIVTPANRPPRASGGPTTAISPEAMPTRSRIGTFGTISVSVIARTRSSPMRTADSAKSSACTESPSTSIAPSPSNGSTWAP